MVHPVVRTHPENGRKALFVSEHFTTRIVGIPEDESRDLLGQLFAHSTQPALQYRHAWQPGDMVFWDNRSRDPSWPQALPIICAARSTARPSKALRLIDPLRRPF